MLTMAMMMLSSSKSPSRRARTSLLTPASLMMLLLQLLPRPMMSGLHHQDHLQDQHHCTVRKGRVFINSPPEKSNLSLLLEGGRGINQHMENSICFLQILFESFPKWECLLLSNFFWWHPWLDKAWILK